jgi:alanine-synthesizing transaminase
MGNPDGPTPPHIVAKLIEAVQNPKTHGYSVSRGITGLRRACAGYYARRFGVELDPEREIIVTLGSKEGLANLAQAITAPGDIVLVPNPCYPIHAFGFIMAGASVRHVPVGPEFDFLNELKKAVRHRPPKPSISTFTARSSSFAAGTILLCCPISLMQRSTSTVSRRPRSSRCLGPEISRSSSPRLVRLIRWPAGALALPSAMRG